MRKNTLSLGLGLLASVMAVSAFAATTTTGTLSVKATVVATCNLNSGGTGGGNALLNFGNVTSTINAIDADTTAGGNNGLSIICTNGTPYSVTANTGLNVAGTQRNMKAGGTDVLPYNLYSDSARANAFPTTGTTLAGTGTGTAQTVPVYGRIPAGVALPAPGTYVDTVVLTVAY